MNSLMRMNWLTKKLTTLNLPSHVKCKETLVTSAGTNGSIPTVASNNGDSKVSYPAACHGTQKALFSNEAIYSNWFSRLKMAVYAQNKSSIIVFFSSSFGCSSRVVSVPVSFRWFFLWPPAKRIFEILIQCQACRFQSHRKFNCPNYENCWRMDQLQEQVNYFFDSSVIRMSEWAKFPCRYKTNLGKEGGSLP